MDATPVDGIPELRSLPRRAVSVLPFAQCLMSALLWVAFVIFVAIQYSAHLPAGAHLPWPPLTWLFATPGGALVMVAVAAAFTYGPLLLIQTTMLPRRWLVGSADVTEVSILRWRRHPAAGLPLTWAERWLGQGVRAHTGSLALLGGALALWVIGGVLWLGAIARLNQETRCPISACPSGFLLWMLAFAGAWFSALWVGLATFRWLRHIEAQCGIRFRYRASASSAPLYYVRLPGVAAEEASARLAQVTPATHQPALRYLAYSMLVLFSYVVAALAYVQLDLWLLPYWMR